MCYVGIVGKRHSGRETAAWLIAHAIEYNIRGMNFSEWDEMYKKLVDYVIEDPEVIESTAHCTIDTFGGYILDFVKLFCPPIADLDLGDKHVIINYIICPDTFDVRDNTQHEYDDLLVSHDKYVPGTNAYLYLEDFIIYFANDVMKKSFGKNVWLNVARHSIVNNSDNEYKIFWDVKTNEEKKFIKKKGTLIKLENIKRETEGGYRDIEMNDQDIVLNTAGELRDMGRKFWAIAEYIVSK